MANSLSIRRTAGVIFVTLLLAYGYVLPRWADWNQNSRFDLTRALVEHRTVAIDQYAANTGDYAIVNGRTVSDKAPGLSLFAVPPYALFRVALRLPPFGDAMARIAQRGAFSATLNPTGTGLTGEKTEVALALAWVTFICVAVPTALLGVLIFLFFNRFTPRTGLNATVAILVMLATPFVAYANAFYGHVPVAVTLFAAFWLILTHPTSLTRGRVVALGALLGTALILEYPAALIVAALGVWTLVLLRQQRYVRGIVWLALGSAPFLFLLAIYDYAAYGTLLPTGYAHSTLWQGQHSEGFVSLTYPKPDALWGITFGEFRGLFFLAPVLLLAVPGCVLWWRSGRDRAALIVCLWSVVAFLLFDASSAMWWGGFAVGPRYVLPMLPFCIAPIGALIPALQRGRLLAAAALTGVSVIHVWAQTLAGQQYPPDTLLHPLTQYVGPHLHAGDVARNFGMAMGLHGLWSLAPLMVIMLFLAGGGILFSRARQYSAIPRMAEATYVRS